MVVNLPLKIVAKILKVSYLRLDDLAFTIQLGDIIDGNTTPEQTLADLATVLDICDGLSMPLYHVVGNHCMQAGAQSLQEKLSLKPFYYDFTAPEAEGWRVIVLDGNDAGYGVISDTQLDWLEIILTKAAQRGERVIVFNH